MLLKIQANGSDQCKKCKKFIQWCIICKIAVLQNRLDRIVKKSRRYGVKYARESYNIAKYASLKI